jgi:hypothetical protein
MNNLINTIHHATGVPIAYLDIIVQHSLKCQALGLKSIGPAQMSTRILFRERVIELKHPLYELDIFPESASEPYSWVVPSSPSTPFSLPTEKVIAYLRVPVCDHRPAQITLDDDIFWVCGDLVVAAAQIDEVLYDDVIVKDEFLIVPVLTVPFRHRFKPFRLAAAGERYRWGGWDDEHVDLDDVLLLDDKNPFSCLAREIPVQDGFAFLLYIEDDYRSAQ